MAGFVGADPELLQAAAAQVVVLVADEDDQGCGLARVERFAAGVEALVGTFHDGGRRDAELLLADEDSPTW